MSSPRDPSRKNACGTRFLVKVIDFGLARSTANAEGSAHVTMGGFVGTPQYASPEQLQEQDLDTRSDIYSLGITLWYLLAGRPPFTGPLGNVFLQHLTKDPPWDQLGPLADSPLLARRARGVSGRQPTPRRRLPQTGVGQGAAAQGGGKTEAGANARSSPTTRSRGALHALTQIRMSDGLPASGKRQGGDGAPPSRANCAQRVTLPSPGGRQALTPGLQWPSHAEFSAVFPASA